MSNNLSISSPFPFQGHPPGQAEGHVRQRGRQRDVPHPHPEGARRGQEGAGHRVTGEAGAMKISPSTYTCTYISSPSNNPIPRYEYHPIHYTLIKESTHVQQSKTRGKYEQSTPTLPKRIGSIDDTQLTCFIPTQSDRVFLPLLPSSRSPGSRPRCWRQAPPT